MIQFERPPKDAGFDQAVKAAREKIQGIIDANEKPASDDFEDLWGNYKPAFAAAQHNKCSYCELEVIAGQPGDVEHYRPKSNVTTLQARGKESANSASVRGRKCPTICDTGFWWQAYDWNNYLLACRVCNSTWKKNLFPFLEHPANIPPTEAQPNTPLLLNPFEGEDPVNHLRFNDFGAIFPRDDSPFGRETIAVCGLDRIALTNRRKTLAKRIHRKSQQLTNELRAANPDQDEIRRLAQELAEEGSVTECHCGMVRSIVKDYLDVPWEDIEALAL